MRQKYEKNIPIPTLSFSSERFTGPYYASLGPTFQGQIKTNYGKVAAPRVPPVLYPTNQPKRGTENYLDPSADSSTANDYLGPKCSIRGQEVTVTLMKLSYNSWP